MIDDFLVCTLRFCTGGGKIMGEEGSEVGGELDVGTIQALLMFVGSGVKEMDTGEGG